MKKRKFIDRLKSGLFNMFRYEILNFVGPERIKYTQVVTVPVEFEKLNKQILVDTRDPSYSVNQGVMDARRDLFDEMVKYVDVDFKAFTDPSVATMGPLTYVDVSILIGRPKKS